MNEWISVYFLRFSFLYWKRVPISNRKLLNWNAFVRMLYVWDFYFSHIRMHIASVQTIFKRWWCMRLKNDTICSKMTWKLHWKRYLRIYPFETLAAIQKFQWPKRIFTFPPTSVPRAQYSLYSIWHMQNITFRYENIQMKRIQFTKSKSNQFNSIQLNEPSLSFQFLLFHTPQRCVECIGLCILYAPVLKKIDLYFFEAILFII